MTEPRDLLISRLYISEGTRLSPYKDSRGNLTIGVGHNLDQKPISKAASDQILSDDVDDAKSDLDRNIPWWSTLGPTRQVVLWEMCFNMGIGGLLKFKNMLSMTKTGQFNEAADEMLNSVWADQVGKRAIVLSQMMRTGIYHA